MALGYWHRSKNFSDALDEHHTLNERGSSQRVCCLHFSSRQVVSFSQPLIRTSVTRLPGRPPKRSINADTIGCRTQLIANEFDCFVGAIHRPSLHSAVGFQNGDVEISPAAGIGANPSGFAPAMHGLPDLSPLYVHQRWNKLLWLFAGRINLVLAQSRALNVDEIMAFRKVVSNKGALDESEALFPLLPRF